MTSCILDIGVELTFHAHFLYEFEVYIAGAVAKTAMRRLITVAHTGKKFKIIIIMKF
jgi:hypothetical protein